MTHPFFAAEPPRPALDPAAVAPAEAGVPIEAAPTAPAPEATGYARPPRATRFQPGRSGNPHGRPRRPRLPQGAVPAARTELERALAAPVEVEIGGRVRPVSVIRMVVSRLTARALSGDVVACRELARLWSEAEATRAAREAEAARRIAEEAAAAEAAEEAARAQAQAAAAAAQAAARTRLENRACSAAIRAGEDDMEPRDRALKVLDAAEFERDADEPATLSPWVMDVALAHGPDGTPGADDRPLDLDEVGYALARLGVSAPDERGEAGLAGWFIDAARARLASTRADPRLDPGDEALLQLVRVDDGAPPDWPARLRAAGG